MPTKDPTLQSVQTSAERFLRMLRGDFGGFFNTLTEECPTDGTLFPRLVKMLRSKKERWNDALPVCTNYFQAITNIISDFAVGDGVRFHFTKEDPRTDAFAAWWASADMDRALTQTLQHTIAAGGAGVVLNKTPHETITPTLVNATSTVPGGGPTWGYAWDDVSIVTEIPHPKRDGQTLNHSVQYTKNDTETQVQVRLTEPNGNDATSLLSALPEECKPSHIACTLPVFPVVYMHAPRRDQNGFGISFFEAITAQVQTLSFLDTVATIELQTHFLSKLAIPRSVVQTDPSGMPNVRAMEYIVFEDDGMIPQFIQKDNKFFADLITHTRQMKESIALSTGIPFELLSHEGTSAQEKVELALIRQRPFRQVIRSHQRLVRAWAADVFRAWWGLSGYNISACPNVSVILPESFTETDAETRAQLLEDYKAGLISHLRYIKLTNPELTETEAQAIVNEAKAARKTAPVPIQPENESAA